MSLDPKRPELSQLVDLTGRIAQLRADEREMAEAHDPPLLLLEAVHLELAKCYRSLSEVSEQLFEDGDQPERDR